jgi:hypothetical protein
MTGDPALSAHLEPGLKRFRLRSRDLEWRDIDGEMVGLDVEASHYLAANSSGTLVWKMLAQGATRGELVEGLVEGCQIDRETASRDVEAFLTELSARGLLED